MKRKEQLKFCRICFNRKLDFNKGLLCKLTNTHPVFEENCENFKEDQQEKERLLVNDLSATGDKRASQSIDPKKNKETGGLILLAGILIVIFSLANSAQLGFWIIPFGLIAYGGFTYSKGIEQEKILKKEIELESKINDLKNERK